MSAPRCCLGLDVYARRVPNASMRTKTALKPNWHKDKNGFDQWSHERIAAAAKMRVRGSERCCSKTMQ